MPTVLIVDDSATVRGFARLFLKQLAVEVREAEEGAQALQIARADAPALAIVDVHMPGMDGLTFLREVRKDPSLSALPVVLLTGEASEAIRAEGRAAGATGFLGKPLRGDELKSLVQKYVRPPP